MYTDQEVITVKKTASNNLRVNESASRPKIVNVCTSYFYLFIRIRSEYKYVYNVN